MAKILRNKAERTPARRRTRRARVTVLDCDQLMAELRKDAPADLIEEHL